MRRGITKKTGLQEDHPQMTWRYHHNPQIFVTDKYLQLPIYVEVLPKQM